MAKSSPARRVIEAEDLSMVYPRSSVFLGRRSGPHRALHEVSLSLDEGEIVGLVGPNGAGKTTLIRVLSTMVLPTSGWARVAGYDVVDNAHAVRRLVGVVSSNERSFFWRLSGRENLEFFSALYQISAEDAVAWREELIDLLGLHEIADRRFDQYSTGQKQRMALARGLLTRPQILLMDEPTKGVDPVGAKQIVELIQERVLNLWHPTILVTSHNLSEIERLCSRVLLMDHGRIVALGSIDELRMQVRPRDVYRMTLRGLGSDQIESLAVAAGSDPSIEIQEMEGAIETTVAFPIGSEGFSRFVRAVIQNDGELMTCTRSRISLDDVFLSLVSAASDDHRETS